MRAGDFDAKFDDGVDIVEIVGDGVRPITGWEA